MGAVYNGFESGVAPEDWRSALFVSLFKGKGEMTDCSNYRGIVWLEKIYEEILLDKVPKVNKGLIDD